jgi:hypothetical protein
VEYVITITRKKMRGEKVSFNVGTKSVCLSDSTCLICGESLNKTVSLVFPLYLCY